ncbi:hypothetical protein MMC18_002382 [Xylographa bjoerkii]|nr:hypothetical protein [Xylographa bjoerkii]
MTQVPLGLPPHLLPRPKAPPTSSSTTSLHALATSITPHLSRSSSQSRQASPSTIIPTSQSEVSDKTTAALIQRVLCSQSYASGTDARTIDELLPPLTSSNDVDLQLYAIIAVVVKEFVYSWYGRITPDQGFVEEVVRIFAHCTRALEQRIRTVDMERLVLDEIPQLVEGHIKAFRTSHQIPYPPSIVVDPRVVYHTLVPHPAFSPAPSVKAPTMVDEQSRNEEAYRQLLVQGALAVLLPTEDLGNACLRTLVADVIGEMILGNGIGGKACEGWFIWEGITKLAESVKARVERKDTGEELETNTRSRLEKFGLLSETNGTPPERMKTNRSAAASEAFWRILQSGYLAFLAMRFIILGFVAAYSRPPHPLTSSRHGKDEGAAGARTAAALSSSRPLLGFRIFPLISLLLDLSQRHPWFVGWVCLVQHHLVRRPLSLGADGGLVDNFLRTLVAKKILTPSHLPPLLRTLRTALFPANALAPPRAVPSPEEQVAIKRRCAEAILDLLPPVIARRFFATSSFPTPASKDVDGDGEAGGPQDVEREMMLADLETVLDVFGDVYMNKHLVFGVVELCVVRLMPEVGQMGVRELMEARLGEGWEDAE